MSERRVKKNKKRFWWRYYALCNPEECWSPRKKTDAINDIETRIHTYYVQDFDGQRSDIHVVDVQTGEFLRTDPNGEASDNLNNLPDC